MIDLYTWPTPNGRKVSIALEEFGLEYAAHAVNLQKDEQFAPEFLAISPNNKIPAIVDRSNGQAVMESGAILIYLAEKCDQFWGENRYQTLQWLMLQMGGIGPMLGQVHYFKKYNSGKSVYAEERFYQEAQRLYGVLDQRLGDAEYLAGEYSIADMATWPWISRFEWQQISLTEYPNVKRWYTQIANRAAVQKGYDVPMFVNAIPQAD
ncbi:glutathione S-transferase N-terminal domain-containing protein [Pseudomonadales bacterium]|nr:glutathione S-transferase N-terminal domain-containing protein [Pseudomonadales bacterium]MDB0050567.1 glutathione S-transferase N-terminal domain-containing protein [Pseudomonadales bacterium]MDB2595035.1 glutathione S-transferase N-terminal domain-containing protein [Pseudomonadales bacterium]MDB2647225.1 glutathione S-transferase N-terminal domain-containing protein [Pseudomonadales bacterium]